LRRVIGPILLVSFLALGSGLMEYWHNLQHEMEDAIEAAQAPRMGGQESTPTGVPKHHDENNCPVHAQLHMPAMPVAWVPLLILMGAFVAFLSELAEQRAGVRVCLNIDCRGPPAC